MGWSAVHQIFFACENGKDNGSTWIIMISDHPGSEKDY
jgi:hypothetical protein